MALKDRVFQPLALELAQKYQKFSYSMVSRKIGGADVVFFNYGYEEDPPMALPLEASDEADRYGIQLYHRTGTQADISGRRVLEVGCGHGGGASYLMRTFHPVSYTGLDLNPNGIAYCRQRHKISGLDFVRGDAEKLPFPDQSFDAVVNVESSGHYRSLPRFLAEVARVLCPEGHFLYADLYPSQRIAAWEAALAEAPLRMLSQRVINAEVIRGIEKASQRWLDAIDRQPAFVRGLARSFLSARLATTLGELESGARSYRMYCFAKA